MNDVVAARALHVLAVVIWVGGVSMVTMVMLPAIRHGALGQDRLQAFQAIENRFAWQARTAVIVVGLTGFYMTWRLDLWERFRTAGFWWMHAMVCLWLLFTFALFVAEPFILKRYFRQWATARPEVAFAWLHRVGVAGTERFDDPRRGRGKPGMVDLLNKAAARSHAGGRKIHWEDGAWTLTTDRDHDIGGRAD